MLVLTVEQLDALTSVGIGCCFTTSSAAASLASSLHAAQLEREGQMQSRPRAATDAWMTCDSDECHQSCPQHAAPVVLVVPSEGPV